MSDPYAVPSDPAKRHSAALTDGVDRAAARAMLKGIGLDDEALSRPLVGIATSWIETMPCNWNQRELARHVRRGIIEAGGTPIEFNTIAVSDGVSMGTEGMRSSLVSRETIADSIELVVRGHLLDGLEVRSLVTFQCTGKMREDRFPEIVDDVAQFEAVEHPVDGCIHDQAPSLGGAPERVLPG